ncbi:MAG TPA: ATP-dependent DNA helicase UvrD2 [Acidimicrobiia bacterium]
MDALLEGLDATQRDAVTSRAAPLAILAGAGSGKTRVLTRRIAWQSSEELIDPAHTLAVTFTRKAAGELRARLARLGVRESVTAGTFHAIALAQLRRRADEQGRTMPELLDRKVRILMRLLPNRGREGALAAAEIASEIEWAKARLVKPDGYEAAVTLAGRATPRPPADVAAIFASYEREKRKRGLVDFDDLISGCADVLEREADFAAAQRWRFRHLFVDEFQDASAAQFRLLRAWLGDRSDLCVVGDPDQAIYGFAGADASYLGGFRRVFSAEQFPDVGVVQLGSNYRSSPQVVAAASAVLGPPGRRRREVHAARPDGPLPTFTEYASADDEARGVARALRDAESAQLPWSRMAVLYRVNAQSALFEEALTRAGIPFRVRGGERFLERQEVQVALDALRAGARDGPHRPFAEHLTDMATDAESVADERREHVDALVRLGHEYLEADGGRGSVDGFLEFLQTSLRGDDAGNSAGNGVELLTFHRAKGLEFDTVFVTGLERGLVPISHAKTPEAMDEEQRLLYVALSRAERGLHLTWARERTVGGRVARRTRSSWIQRVEDVIHPPAPGAAPPDGDVRDTFANARERVARAKGGSTRTKNPADVADADAPLYDALVDWRLRLSRAASAPAYVIFPNTTLAAIAAARPRTPSALLDVPGVGPVKADRYGEAVLAMVADHSP